MPGADGAPMPPQVAACCCRLLLVEASCCILLLVKASCLFLFVVVLSFLCCSYTLIIARFTSEITFFLIFFLFVFSVGGWPCLSARCVFFLLARCVFFLLRCRVVVGTATAARVCLLCPVVFVLCCVLCVSPCCCVFVLFWNRSK